MSSVTEDLYGLDTARGPLTYYLRALWNEDFTLRASDQPLSQQRPFLSELGIHLPRHYHSHRGTLLRNVYRAAAAHAAAHLTFSTHRFERKSLKPVQIAIISLLEDARAEQLAINAMPGLRSLWLSFFDPRGHDSITVEALLLRLSHVLLDPTREDDNPWVSKARRMFYTSQEFGTNPQALREIGSLLGNDIGQMRSQFNAKSYVIEPVYRDDNLFLWTAEDPPEETRIEDSGFRQRDDAAKSTQRNDARADEDARFRPREVAGNSDAADAHDELTLPRYPEWDERTGRYKEHWCSIIEQIPEMADSSALRAAMNAHAGISTKLARLLQARKQGQAQRLRRQPDGEELEIDALINAMSELRSAQMPDLRVHRRTRMQKPDLAVLLLLDLSVSTNAALGEGTLLSLIREASILLGEAIALSGDQLAIHGFRSNGRHEIQYLRFKEFGDAMDDTVLSRLYGVQGALSTRMGAAIRHASRMMRNCRSSQRLIILLTDGEPHDIDVFDSSLLVHDAARAVARSTAEGTPVFGVSVDNQAGHYLPTIFNPYCYQIIDSIAQLPQRLPELYLRLSA